MGELLWRAQEQKSGPIRGSVSWKSSAGSRRWRYTAKSYIVHTESWEWGVTLCNGTGTGMRVIVSAADDEEHAGGAYADDDEGEEHADDDEDEEHTDGDGDGEHTDDDEGEAAAQLLLVVEYC